MSLIPTQAPTEDATYAKNTVPVTIISTQSAITASLWLFGDNEPLITVSYVPDFSGMVYVDFSDIYKDVLKTELPSGAADVVQQNDYMVKFSIKLSDDSSNDAVINFWVCNALLKSSAQFKPWSKYHFLTNQPLEKPTTYDSLEYLTFLDLDDPAGRKVKVVFYPNSGGNETRQLTTTSTVGCYTVDVSYDIVIRLAHHFSTYYKGYYDIILTDSSDNELARQRYIYRERSGKEHYFLFTNALGGVDTMVCDGENVLQPEVSHNIGRFGKRYIALDDTDDHRVWTQNTGMMPHKYRNWVHELLSSKQAAAIYNGARTTIVVTETDIAMGDGGQLASASFSYMLTETDNIVSDTERAADRMLHQSVADDAEEMEDKTVGQVLEFAPEPNEDYFVTEEVTIATNKIYVAYPQTEETHTIEYAVGGKWGYTFDTVDEGPFIINKSASYSLQFRCREDIVPALELRYYPVISKI